VKQLSSIAVKLLQLHDGWVIGTAADPSCDLKTVRDIDIMIPWSNWSKAALLVPEEAHPNTFGGWKFDKDGVTYDVWPDELGSCLSNAFTKWVWHYRSGIRWNRASANVGVLL